MVNASQSLRKCGKRCDDAELPSGTVTFLVTDIEGSTALVRQLGGSYSHVLAEHQRILREAFAAHGGHEVDTQGDSFFVAFRRAKDAVAAGPKPQASSASATRTALSAPSANAPELDALLEDGWLLA